MLIINKIERKIRKNLIKKFGYQRKRNIVFLSFPKSGRTWIRNFLNYYYFNLYPLSLLDWKHTPYNSTEIPYINFTHEGYTGNAIKKTNHIKIPSHIRKNKTIFLLRDPRDTFISYYYQLTKRNDPAKKYINSNIDWDTVTLEELLRHEKFGIEAIVNFITNWYSALNKLNKESVLTIFYESVQRNPHENFKNILLFIGENNINHNAFIHAMEESTFERMKNKEETGIHGQFELKAKNPDDINSYKIRSGKIGEYMKLFNKDDLKYCESIIQRLPKEILEIIRLNSRL